MLLRCSPRRLATCALVALAASASLGGCGNSSARTHGANAARAALAPPCAPGAAAALARAAALDVRALEARPFTATSGAASCRFRARTGDGRSFSVLAELDSAPQAYFRLEREAVEYAQNVLWEHQGSASYPRHLSGIGLDADWFPAEDLLATTDGVRLITIVFATGPQGAAARERIAAALARAYLGPAVPPHR